MISPRVGRFLTAALLAGALLGTASVAQAQQGSITGQVIDRATQRPLGNVQVYIVGSNRNVLTNAEGRYLFPGVAPGTVELRASLVGYEAQSQTVTVHAGETAVADFTLAVSAITIDELIVTATGSELRKREIGNSVATITPAAMEPGITSNFSQMLNARTPGMTVIQAGGTTGTGTRIRIRGINSVSLANDPLIIIDGVIVDGNADSYSIGLGGQSTSRINDINSEDIEKVEVLKGPAASALYGTAAANGVIQITTKRGSTGRARWNAYTEYGAIVDPHTYPTNYKMFGTVSSTGATTSNCNIDNFARGLCVQDSLVTFNPLEHYRDEIFRTGSRIKHGLSVSGGTEMVTYYLSGDYESEDGIYPSNYLDRINARVNLSAQLRENLDVSAKVGYVTSEVSLPQNDNNTVGLVPQGLLGGAQNDPVRNGFYLQSPKELMATMSWQGIDRYTGALSGNWQPLDWLTFSSTGGMDFLDRFDHQTTPPNKIRFSTASMEGSRTSNRYQIANYSFNLSGTARFNIGNDIVGRTSAGVSYQQDKRRGTQAFGARLLSGTEGLSGTNARFAVGETYSDFRQVGTFLQQQVSYQDRIHITGSLRGDDNSAFGQDFGLIFYPSVSASWVISEESFFPANNILTSLRLRTAYGRSGLRPGFRDAPQFYNPVAVRYAGDDIPGITVGGVGNPNLKPERTTEYELGFEASLLSDRLGVDVTYYNKTSEDALISRRLAPSLGVSTTRFENIGEVSNKGVEAIITANLLNAQSVRWDVTLSASTNENKLVRLGEGVEPIIFGLGGDTQRHAEGFPLGGYWSLPILGWEDKNGDGILSRVGCPGPNCEVLVGDTAEFIGKILPGRELSFSTNATLFDRVRLYALLDYKGDYMIYNATREFRCVTVYNCREVHDKTAPLADQAKAIAYLRGAYEGYYEDATFLKLREAAITFMAPQEWARRMRLADLSLTLSGRNLYTWTDYSGLDPEINFTAGNFNSADFLSQPPLRYYTARVTINF